MATEPASDQESTGFGARQSAYDSYVSPLASRNASERMLAIWSPRHKFNMWRRIWLAVAEAQRVVTSGWDSPLVGEDQIAELRAVVGRGISDGEILRAEEIERELRHDVMAHVHCLGEQAPKARSIIHLGCTSQDIVCNADLMILHEALGLIASKVVEVVMGFGAQASKAAALPALGFTHYQPAQPVTMGRRFAQWASDLAMLAERLEREASAPRAKGMRGATGTQASFLALFGGDDGLVESFEAEAMARMGGVGARAFGLVGQTYPRVFDSIILGELASVAATLHKIATDIRLLSNRKEVDEPFGGAQIGSSAMPYKRNPMRCERICGLSRFVINLAGNAHDTCATQWLERTLDDSSNRRLSLPGAFLALDGALDLMRNVADGLIVHEAMVRRNLMAELPFLATENILMEAVKAGGDRQDLHERIRVHAQEAGLRVKRDGLENDLIERLRADGAFSAVHHLLSPEALLDPMRYIGRSVRQTERLLLEVVEPLRRRWAEALALHGAHEPRV